MCVSELFPKEILATDITMLGGINMNLLKKVYLRQIDFFEDDFLATKKESLVKHKTLEIIYLYEFSDDEYKAEFYMNGSPMISEWLTEEEILKNYIPLENVCNDFNVQYFEKKITEKQFYYIYNKFLENKY